MIVRSLIARDRAEMTLMLLIASYFIALISRWQLHASAGGKKCVRNKKKDEAPIKRTKF